MFLDHLTHIARAASKSWRASAWLLERTFPEECNLRHRAPQPADDGMPHMPTDGVPNDGVPLAPPVSDAPHKPEAQAREESHATEESPLPDDSTGDDAVPTTPFADSGRATQQSPTNPSPPTTDSCPPTTDPNLAHFETDALLKELSLIGYRTTTSHNLPPDDPVLNWDKTPLPPPRNRNALRERIYAENLTGFEIDRAIEEENRKEQFLRNAAQLYTNYACDPADLYNKYPNNDPPGVPPS
jgi:hypothetical protein